MDTFDALTRPRPGERLRSSSWDRTGANALVTAVAFERQLLAPLRPSSCTTSVVARYNSL